MHFEMSQNLLQGNNREIANLLLSITGSTGCGSPSLKNALAYNSPKKVFLVVKKAHIHIMSQFSISF